MFLTPTSCPVGLTCRYQIVLSTEFIAAMWIRSDVSVIFTLVKLADELVKSYLWVSIGIVVNL